MEMLAAPAYEHRKLVIFTDGAARGNPGPSASGYLVFEKGRLIRKEEFYNGIATNNTAEYKAIIAALEWCAKAEDTHKIRITLNSDSEVAVKQLNGSYKTKSASLKALNRKAKSLAESFDSVEFANVRRSNRYISAVDKALNSLLDDRESGQQRIA
jgi:ribonuclease HI